MPVLPVARELITKTKWIASKKDSTQERPGRPSTPKLLKSPHSRTRDAAGRKSRDGPDSQRAVPMLPDAPSFLTQEPELMRDATIGPKREGRIRQRAMSLFKRNKSHGPKDSKDSISSSDTTPTMSVSRLPCFPPGASRLTNVSRLRPLHGQKAPDRRRIARDTR